MKKENEGPAETIINTVLAYSEHCQHNRPGFVVPDTSPFGLLWAPVTHKLENGVKVVYRLDKVGKKSVPRRMGVLQADNAIVENGRNVGTYRPAGLFPEVVLWMYRQVSEVWKMDNEFSAKWATYVYGQEHRDLKCILAAFMLVQSRKGSPVVDAATGEVTFHDDDFRDVGEAMLLINKKDGKDLNPKLLLRIHAILSLPEIAQVNRELGFGKSARKPFLGRWPKAVEKWLRFREDNPKLLEGLVKAGFRTTVMDLARIVGYKPSSPKFFEVLRWKQAQAKEGHRSLAIGQSLVAAETWESLTETQICEKIVKEHINYKRVVGMLPRSGLTRAIMAAVIESNGLSDKDLIILAPTLEDLGLLNVQDIRVRWEKALAAADDMRAINIAQRMRTRVAQEKMQEAGETAAKKAVEEVSKNLEIYFIVDVSGSMEDSIKNAITHVTKLLPAFPQDRLHISVFNTVGRELKLKHASAEGVAATFHGIKANGGTDYGAGVRALQHNKPQPENDVLFIFVGDEDAAPFASAVKTSKLNPMAFGFVKVGRAHYSQAVRETAVELGIPCFMIDERTFADPYAIPRTLRNMIASTPVNREVGRTVSRTSLVETILGIEILKKPSWALSGRAQA